MNIQVIIIFYLSVRLAGKIFISQTHHCRGAGRGGGWVGKDAFKKDVYAAPKWPIPGPSLTLEQIYEGQNTGYIYSSQDLFSVVFTGAKNGKHTTITVAGYYKGEA